MTALVVGGAGFIGANVSSRHLARGDRVIVFDNLSRGGASENLLWLEERGGDRLRVVLGDAARERGKLEREVRQSDVIYHFAGQVAVTTSLLDPVADHEANLGSTLNLLEAMRATGSRAPLLFASTNKVYGNLAEVGTRLDQGRWGYGDGRAGVDESTPLDFHSPYGCSKGAADQYVRDYARVYGLRTVVLRQSCIYGPRQFGVEDQGWLVHFILAFAFSRPLTIYGDGRQVRDALYIDDLVDLYEAAAAQSEALSGEVLNIGGGPSNRLSILELVDILRDRFGHQPEIRYGPWRQGDQRVFVSDNSKAGRLLGWAPRVPIHQGIDRTIEYVRGHLSLFRQAGAESLS